MSTSSAEQPAADATEQVQTATARYNRVLTVSVLLLVVAFAVLGRWQFGRIYRPVDGYSAEPPAVPVSSLVHDGSGPAPVDLARLVTVTGTYDPASQRIVVGKTVDGSPASWVVTSLVATDGTRFAVVRGWTTTSDASLIAPPAGAVSLTARLEPGDAAAPFLLVRTAQSPPDPLSLQPVPAAPPNVAAPRQFHLQNAIYVVQWYLLVVVVIVAWWRLRRRPTPTVT